MRLSPNFIRSAWFVVFSAVLVTLTGPLFANQPPTVNAGEDQPTTRINNMNVYLFGEVSDDSTAEPATLWNQVSGPAAANIVDPASLLTLITFPQTGTYVIELQANDGTLIGRDSLIFTVLDSLPFMILHPRDNEQIVIGQRYMIRWQLDPMRMCEVTYSLNDGLSYERISLTGSVRDSFEWDVPLSYKDSARSGIMLVHEYQHEVFYTTSTFILVESLSGVKSGAERPASSGPRVTLDRGGVLRIAGMRADPRARITVFSANGATVLCSRVQNGAVPFSAPPRGVLVYRIDTKAGKVDSGRLVRE